MQHLRQAGRRATSAQLDELAAQAGNRTDIAAEEYVTEAILDTAPHSRGSRPAWMPGLRGATDEKQVQARVKAARTAARPALSGHSARSSSAAGRPTRSPRRVASERARRPPPPPPAADRRPGSQASARLGRRRPAGGPKDKSARPRRRGGCRATRGRGEHDLAARLGSASYGEAVETMARPDRCSRGHGDGGHPTTLLDGKAQKVSRARVVDHPTQAAGSSSAMPHRREHPRGS